MFDLNRVNKKLLKGEKERLMREADGGLMAAEAAAFKGAAGDDKGQTTPDKKPTPPSHEAAGPANEGLSTLLAPDVHMQLQAEREQAGRHIKTIPAQQELSRRVREFDFHMPSHKRGSKMCPLTAGKDMCVVGSAVSLFLCSSSSVESTNHPLRRDSIMAGKRHQWSRSLSRPRRRRPRTSRFRRQHGLQEKWWPLYDVHVSDREVGLGGGIKFRHRYSE